MPLQTPNDTKFPAVPGEFTLLFAVFSVMRRLICVKQFITRLNPAG